ncbi:MAG TPA: hypothetical protein DEB06_06965 [Phycisphaerales bacterium]|nr:hypothetical protein [Phycisphaerales bacterium]
MTREHKISLILGFAVVLIVGVLISDHFSKSRTAPLADAEPARTPLDPLGLTETPGEDPSLVLVDSEGRPDPVEQIAASPLTSEPSLASAEPTLDRSGLEWLRDQVNGAVNDLRNGQTPPAAMQTDAPAMLVMGHPSVGPSDHPDARPTPGRVLETPAAGQPAQPERASGSAPPSFELYTVKPGDSLWKLAERFLGNGHRHTELAALNKDRLAPGGGLRVGGSIRIPRRETGALPATSVVPAATKPGLKPAFPADPPRGATTYTVQEGDTLGEIAQRLLGSSRRTADIVKANPDKLEDADDIKSGMVLKIPSR